MCVRERGRQGGRQEEAGFCARPINVSRNRLREDFITGSRRILSVHDARESINVCMLLYVRLFLFSVFFFFLHWLCY